MSTHHPFRVASHPTFPVASRRADRSPWTFRPYDLVLVHHGRLYVERVDVPVDGETPEAKRLEFLRDKPALANGGRPITSERVLGLRRVRQSPFVFEGPYTNLLREEIDIDSLAICLWPC